MKCAVVIGARQDIGFTLCAELLEHDYVVYAKDFSKWQSDKKVDRWLYIGRNSNLYYQEIDSKKEWKVENEEDNGILIVPIIDINKESELILHDEYMNLLNNYCKVASTLVFIHSTSHLHALSPFLKDIDRLKTRIPNEKIIEIFIQTEQYDSNPELFYNAQNKGVLRFNDGEKDISEQIINLIIEKT